MDIDNEGAFFKATNLLISLGHEKIGIINGPTLLTFATHRLRGLKKALSENNLHLDQNHQAEGQMSERNGYELAHQMLNGQNRPTAILCASMFLALGAVRAANDLGLAIGSDISIIAHNDDFPYLKPANFRVPMTTTESPIRDAGRQIMRRLSDDLVQNKEPSGEEIWDVELVSRASTGAPR